MQELFFIFSKLVWGLLSPSALLVWLLILATLMLWLNYVSAARKILLFLSVIGLSVMAYPVSDFLMYPLETQFSRPEKLPEQLDGILVLGGAEKLLLTEDWHSAEVGQGAERILTAAELARHYPNIPVIYSGGSNLIQKPDLAAAKTSSIQLLTQAGIDAKRIIVESRARNTAENIVLTKPLLPKQDGTYLLITSAFHMPRAVGVALKQKIKVVPYPVDFRSHSPAYRYWDFDLFAHLDVLESAWHEWIGLAVYFISGKTTSLLPTTQNK